MHRWSKLFIPTLREAPADAEVASHKLLLRAGYIRQLSAGIYSYLPLGQRSINKIIAIVRDEMDKIGQEFLLPTLNPRELWEESGRYAVMGENMFHLKDRKGADLVLAMTHEEVITSIARSELRSYKQLPQIWYQIQTKFRDEPRPKAGLLRVRQFLMKDAYSFDIDAAGLDHSYNLHDAAYRAIFTRCGLQFVAVEADSGAMGGSGSQEFMVYTEAGEDLIASSRDEAGNVVYAANLEKATSTLPPVEDLEGTFDEPDEMHTPGARTIEEVSQYLNANFSFENAAFEDAVLQQHHQMKTMAYVATFSGPNGVAQIPVVILLRGDHVLNEAKLRGVIAAVDLSLMDHGQIMKTFGTPAGYLGPVGLTPLSFDNFRFVQERGLLPKAVSADEQSHVPIYGGLGGDSRDCRSYWKHPIVILDAALEGRTNLIAGANKEGYHYRNVTPLRDFTPTRIADIRNINEGEPDPIAGQPLRLGKAVEVGHIFKLGYKYSESMGASVLDKDGKATMPIMGCYGIGIERILTAAIESSAATFGGDQYALHPSIAPYEVIVTITNVREPALLAAGEKIAAELSAAGIDTLLDDRDERAGVKFKDAELIGVPFRLNIGKKLSENLVELVNRLTHTTTDLPLADITPHLQALLATSKP